MANFSTTEIKFNNQSCYDYDLYMSYISSNGTGDNQLQEMNISTTRVSRRQSIYNYGIANTEILEFEIELYSQNPIYTEKKNQIITWLSGNGKYGKLQIVQEDMLDKYYNCFFQSINSMSVGNLCYGFKCKIICDSPYCYGDKNNYIFKGLTQFNLPNVSSSFIPIPFEAKITVNSGTSFIVTNTTTNESISISNCAVDDIIYINTDLQQIITENNPTKNMIDSFEGEFIKLAQGKNSFTVNGNIDMSLTYSPVYVIGG